MDNNVNIPYTIIKGHSLRRACHNGSLIWLYIRGTYMQRICHESWINGAGVHIGVILCRLACQWAVLIYT